MHVEDGSQRPEFAVIEAPASAFELEQFALEGDRLAVRGRWFGVRGRRFVRPSLNAVGQENAARVLADLEHKPWAAEEEGGLWIAAFPWSGPAPEAQEFELVVAPDLAVRLPPPPRLTGRARSRRTSQRLLEAFRPDDSEEERRHPPTPAKPAATVPEGPGKDFDTAMRAKNRALADRDRAITALSDAREERQAAESARASLEEERDQATAARDSALAARNQALAVRDRAIAARDQACEERDRARVARDGAVARERQAVAERDEAAAELARAATERQSTAVFDSPPPVPRPPVSPPIPREPRLGRPVLGRVPRRTRGTSSWLARFFTVVAIAGVVVLLLIIVSGH
jgi:hypothetical protein